jgi:hypothetical protein
LGVAVLPPPTELGILFLRLGQDNQGLHWLLQVALKRDERYAPARKALVEYYEKKGDKAAADVHRQFLDPPEAAPRSPSP